MSKIPVDTNLTEQLIYKASNIKEADRIRLHLLNESTGCWFFVYANTFEIRATSEFGGKLNEEKMNELKKIVNRHVLP